MVGKAADHEHEQRLDQAGDHGDQGGREQAGQDDRVVDGLDHGHAAGHVDNLVDGRDGQVAAVEDKVRPGAGLNPGLAAGVGDLETKRY